MIAASIYQRIANDKNWFISHFKQIYRNRDKFALGTPNASVVIDCFTIFSIGGCAGYRSIQRIHIGRLVKLWEMGFKYHGFPVVEYIRHNNNQQVHYIYQNQLLTKHFKYDESPMFSSALNAMLRSLQNCNDLSDDYRSVSELRKLF